MGSRTSQLQIRVRPEEKAALKRLAGEAGQSLSAYVLGRVLPSAQLEVAELYRRLSVGGVDHRGTLAELSRVIDGLADPEAVTAIPSPDSSSLSPVLLNCVAALVETVAHRKGVGSPGWVAQVPPLPRPHFGWVLRGLRPHQIRVAPVPFKRRNIFFDPATGPSP